MLTFHGKPEIKEFYVSRAKAHQLADEIVKGQYWSNGKGCAVGCLVHSSSHSTLADEIGIPLQMAYLIDRLFEGMPNENAKLFPLRFIGAIPVGIDAAKVMDKFYLALLADPEHGAVRHAKKEKTRLAIEGVIGLYRRRIEGDNPMIEQWKEKRDAAYAAARAADADANAAYAAYVAAAYADANAAWAAYAAAYADADAAYAAYAATWAAAADAADANAAYAAYAAAYADAANAAASAYAAAAAAADAAADATARAADDRKNSYLWQAELLIQLLKEAK